jgi:hypothetical protein
MNNIDWHCFNVKSAFLAALLLCSFSVRAEETAAADKKTGAPDDSPQIWLTSGFLSHHFKRDAGYNERNYGLGAELHFDDVNAVSAGIYRNSVRQTTHYLHFVWTPLEVGPVRLGAAVGVIDGYPQLNNGNTAFAVMPVVSTSFKVLSQDAGLNLVYIPTIARRVDGALALQLKIRVR